MASVNHTCFEFSQEQLNLATAAVVTGSALAIIACALAVILIIVLKLYRKFLNRLVLYLMVAAGGYSVAFLLAITPVHHSNGEVQVREGLDGLCAAFGFFIQMTEWIFQGTMTWVVVYLTLMAVFKYQADKPKHEVSGLIIILLFPFIINWIPFVSDMYGLSGIWCWLHVKRGTWNGMERGMEHGMERGTDVKCRNESNKRIN